LVQQLRFKRILSKRYNWTDKRTQDEWDIALSNAKTPRYRDEYGELVIYKLRRTDAIATRMLEHVKEISVEDEDAANMSDLSSALDGESLSFF
jgi:hypothetical protein